MNGTKIDELLAVAHEMKTALERIASGVRPSAHSRDLVNLTRRQMMTLAKECAAHSFVGETPTFLRDLRDYDKRARSLYDQIHEGAFPAAETVAERSARRTPFAGEGTIDSLNANHLRSIAHLLAQRERLVKEIHALNEALYIARNEKPYTERKLECQ